MLLEVDFTEFIILLFNSLFDILYNLFAFLDNMIILDGERFGWAFRASLLDFIVGMLVVSIIFGAFIHINKPDDFYSER